MPVPSAITDLSATAASNSPAGTDSPSVLDDIQRAHAAFIRQLHDGTTKASWSAAYRIPFFDASGNYASAADFVRDASGNIGIGTGSPAHRLDVRHSTVAQIVASQSGLVKAVLGSDSSSGAYAGTLTSDDFRLLTNSTERMRINASGRLTLNTTSSTASGADCQFTIAYQGAGVTYGLGFRPSGDNQISLYFANAAGTGIGNVAHSSTGTSYNTTSDYRLKRDPRPLAGSGAFVDALQPKTWTWRDGTPGAGFIAHEVQAVSPSSVTGEKDAVDADGRPVYQSMQASSPEVMANIVAELQSLRRRVAALEGA
jgi:hypothetical protein